MQRSKLILALGALAVVAHVGLVLRVYPPQIFARGEIPLAGDVPRYFATAVGAAETGGLYGYDPYNMAGYPVGLWNSMGKKGFELAHLLLPGIALPRLFYLVLVGLSVFCPLVFWWALRRACPTSGSRRVLFVLTLVFWHFSTDISYFWTFGNVFFPAAACGIVVLGVLLDRILGGRAVVISALGLGLAAAGVFYIHTVVLAAAVAPLLTLLVLRLRAGRLSARGWGGLLIAGALFFALVVWWVIPLAQTRADSLPQPKAWFQGGIKYLIMDLFSDRVYRQPFDRNFLYHVAVVAGLGGTALLWGLRRVPLFFALGVGGVVALAIVYIGPFVPPLRALQPYRFTIPATLLLLAPAAIACDAGFAAVRRAVPAVRGVVVALLLLLAPGFTAYLLDLARPRDPITLDAARRAVLDRLLDVPLRGRVLTDDATLGHLIPYFNRQPVLGGLSTQAFLKHRFAGIDEDGIGFGRMARDWTPEALRQYLDAYGVEIAVFSTASWRALAQGTESPFVLEADVGGIGLYRVCGGDTDLVRDGAAAVRADYAGIAVSEVASESLVLKFHYAPWLTAGPGVRLEPVAVLDDPVPFIRAVPGPGIREFVIRKK